MKKAFLLTIAFFMIMSLTSIANADQLQMDNEWDTEMRTCDIEKDSDGNYYVAGFNLSIGVTRKYDKNHNLIYSKEFDNYQQFLTISLDDDNNSYLLGYDYNDFFMDSNHMVTNKITRKQFITLPHNKIRFKWKCSI